MDGTAILAISQSAAILTTTIHIQDFRDVAGDRHVGRRTFPLISDYWARRSVAATLLAWSLSLARVWQLDVYSAIVFIGLAVVIGARLLMSSTVAEDSTSYQIYNVCSFLYHLLHLSSC